MSFKKRALTTLVASIVLGSIFSAPSQASTTINLSIDCVTNTTARDQYVTNGYIVVYTVTHCNGIGMNWPTGTTYSLSNGSSAIASGTGTSTVFGTLSASTTYTLTLTLPDPIPALFVANSMHSSTQSGGKSGTNGSVTGSFSSAVIYFVPDPSLTAGSSSSSTPTVVAAPSMTALVRPQATVDAKNITCTSGSWIYLSAGATTSSTSPSSITYTLLKDGVKVTSVTPTTVTASQTFSVEGLDASSTYSCSVTALYAGTSGDSVSNGDLGATAKIAATLHDAKLAAGAAYWASINKINTAHGSALAALSTVTGTTADARIAARAKAFDAIQSAFKAAKAKATADRKAAEAAAFVAYAKAINASKTAVILAGN